MRSLQCPGGNFSLWLSETLAVSPGVSISSLDIETRNTTEPHIARPGSTDFSNETLGIMVNGAVSASTPWFSDPYVLLVRDLVLM